MLEHLYGHIQVQNGRAGIDAPSQDAQKEKPSVKRKHASSRAGTPRKRREFETEPAVHAASSSVAPAASGASAPSRPSTAFDDEDASSLSSDFESFDASVLFDEEVVDPASKTKPDKSKPKEKLKKDKKEKTKKREKKKKEKKQEKTKSKSKG